MQQQIGKHGVNVSKPLEKDVLTIMSGQNLDSTPHMKLFWEQQMRLLQTNKMGRRYHPQVIRFAWPIHCKSPSAYRESGDLILPSERVLRDYKNYFKPGAGITKENIEELKEKTSIYTGTIQQYVAVVMDEMKIQENLVSTNHQVLSKTVSTCLLECNDPSVVERFMRDVIEDYFGHQRTQLRGRSDNPSAKQFGYNDLTIAVKRAIVPSVNGNTGGRYGKAKWYTVSDDPVKKRKKK
ncbi:Hypothetical predicted protein [Paramuricea clavata]|uniref:Uncharacterized protein n=1 Tax=Paramuricea clavata TaxID=317549 RepID=A0A6S7I9M7_PARCT|nr:Hypothetical predicted protein [Paramuricea clavata]